jgi:hypothetical protein
LGFLAQGPAFYDLSLKPTVLGLVGVPHIENLATSLSIIDAIGYNIKDNFVYGLAQTGLFAGDLIRIGKGGIAQTLIRGVAPSILSGQTGLLFTAGDVDETGTYWAVTTAFTVIGPNGQRYFSVNVDPTSSGYLTVGPGALTTIPYPIYDWAYVPVNPPNTPAGRYLYALGHTPPSLPFAPLGGTALLRFHRDTGAWDVVKDYGPIGTFGLGLGQIWGAVFASSSGSLYAIDSVLGQMWKFPISTLAAPTYVTEYPPQLNIDGARCFNAPDP